MTSEKLVEWLNRRQKRVPIHPDHFLLHFAVANERERDSIRFQASEHFPFFVRLGGKIKPERVLTVGGDCLEGILCCGKKTQLLAVPDAKYDWLARINAKRATEFFEVSGALSGEGFQVVLVNLTGDFDRDRIVLSNCFDRLGADGLLVADGVRKSVDAFRSFCRGVARKPAFAPTLFGTGILER